VEVPAHGSTTIRLRLTATPAGDAFHGFDAGLEERITEADEFYNRITPQSLNEDERRVHRQALAGMLWSKQFYYFDLEQWLSEHKRSPLLDANVGRSAEWCHMVNADIISMPFFVYKIVTSSTRSGRAWITAALVE
jgi:hypothetical protein